MGGVKTLYQQIRFKIFSIHVSSGLVNVRLKEHKVNEKEVMANLVKINVAKKTLEVRLESSEFGKRKEKRQINKKKKKILENKD